MIVKSWKTEISFSEPFNQTFDGRYGQQWAKSITRTKAIDVKKSTALDDNNNDFEATTKSDDHKTEVTINDTEMEENSSASKKACSNEIEFSNDICASRDELERSSTNMFDEWKRRTSHNYGPKIATRENSTDFSSTNNSQSIASSRTCSPDIDEVSNDSTMDVKHFEAQNVHDPDNELMMESLAELLDLDYEDILRINRLPSGDYDIIFKQ